MAELVRKETYENAIIDAKDMTITEYGDDRVMCYSILELIKRWDGVVGITLSIQRNIPLPPDGRDDHESEI